MQFTVADVKIGQKLQHSLITAKDSVSGLAEGEVEAWSDSKKELLYCVGSNALTSAIHHSFANHYPLRLSPDAIWITLAQGLAKHIEKNAEKLRKHFVAHQGKLLLTVQRNGFVRGNPNNDWPGVFGEFSEKIKEHIGSAHAKIVADFSTTSAVDRAATEVVLLDAMKQYFDYGVSTCCGIPDITLTGKVEDWEALRDRFKSWAAWDLEWWTTPMTRVLDEFVNAAKGQVDKEWWNSIYKYHSAHGSGDSSAITGWVNWLFPYLSSGERSNFIGAMSQEKQNGLGVGDHPNSLSSAPFVWTYYGQELKYKFLAGLTGVTQDPETLTAEPATGWAIQDALTKRRGW